MQTKTRIEIPITGAIGRKTVLMDLDPSKYSQKHILDWFAGNKLYEWETVRVLETTLKPGDTFVDVGAHVGYFSMIGAALVGPTGTVVALEPDLSNGHELFDNQRLNGATQIRFYANAVGARSTVKTLWLNQDNDGGHAFWDVGLHDFNAKSRATPKTRDVVVTALDDFRFLNKVTAIKIDTEGCECDVILGAAGVLERNPDIVVIAEINDFALTQMGTTRHEMRRLMESQGFKMFALPDGEPVELKSGYWPNCTDGNVYNVMFRR